MARPSTPLDGNNISARIRWIGTNGPQARLDPNGFGKKTDAEKIDVLHQQVDELAQYVRDLEAIVSRLSAAQQ